MIFQINHNLQKQIDILCIDDYDFNYDLRNKIFNRQLSLQRFLDEPNALSIRITDCNKLEVGNKTTKPLIIYSVINKKNEQLLQNPFVLNPKKQISEINFQRTNISNFSKDENLFFEYSIIGLNKRYRMKIKLF